MIKHLLLCFLFFISVTQNFSQLVINEGSNKNYSTLADEDGEFEDWIEIYNAGNTAIDLYNYSLSDNQSVPDKWVFPHQLIQPGEFLKVYCSGKDRYASTPFVHVLTDSLFQPQTGWNTHQFDTPFYWDGVSNIVINVCSYNNVGYVTNSVHRQSATTYNSTVFSFEDGSSNACNYNNGYVIQQRPNLRLNGMTIGSGTITNSPYDYPAPYGNWYWGARHQILIKGSELAASGLTAGDIQSLAFDIEYTDPVTYTYVEYSISSVGLNEMTNAYIPLNGYKYHTNFKIDATGENIYLFSPSDLLLSALDVDCGEGYDVSIGSFPDASTTIKKFSVPTPGASNNSSSPADLYAFAPLFTLSSGIYNTPVSVSIIDPNVPNASVYYTTDGSNPDTTSAVWDGTPIYIYQSTVVRAKAYVNGLLPSNISSASYLFNVDHVTPIISVITDNENLFGPTGMFDNPLNDWLKAAHVDYFDSTDAHNLLFTRRTGIIMDGGWGGSRTHPQKSFRIKFNDQVLGQGPINYPINPDRPNRTQFSDFYLRNGSNQFLVLPYKDACQVKMMSKDANLYYSAWRPVTVYINGMYWGLYELREKYNIEMFQTLENAHPDSIEILSLSAFYNYTLRALEGSVQSFYDSYDDFLQINVNDTSFWTQADQYFDMKYYNDYIIAESWMGNVDWPGNNIKIYRSNATNFRWRYCLIDQELALNPNGWTDCYSNHISYLLGQSTDNPFINVWLRGIQNHRFRNYFINRFADQMNTLYLPSRLLSIENGMFEQVVVEMANEYQRWGDPWNVPGQLNAFYNNHITFQNELACRSSQVRDHIQNGFNLPQQVDVDLDVFPSQGGKINISTVTPDTYPWSGVYFDGLPVKIEALPDTGFMFSHWEPNVLIADTLQPVFLDTLQTNAVLFKAYFKPIPGFGTEDQSQFSFQLYPNPSSEFIHVTFSSAVHQDTYSFEILDMQGRKMDVGNNSLKSIHAQLDISGLPHGYYFFKCYTKDGKVHVAPFIKV